MPRIPYTKPPKTYAEQLQLLKSRGLKVNSDAKHQFIFRFKVLLNKYPNIDVTAMGFPSNWESEPLWKFKPTIKQRIRILVAFSLR